LQVASDFAKRNGLFQATVLENRELQDVGQSGRSTRHVELQLPPGLSYVAGDHLAVYGGNPPEVVEGAAQLLGVELDDVVEVALANAEKVTNIIPLNVS
jgi:cytochrome P450 / NADPH-cytochrome P450 reductase